MSFRVGCFRKVPNLPDARPAPRHLVGRAVPKPDPERSANVHSGEVTRRWVLYGPVGAGLMPAGDYQFLYYEGEELVLTQIVSYIPQTVGYPMDIVWTREGADLAIQWTPPAATNADMWYKVLLFPDSGNVIREIVPWDASSARLPNIPLADGATGTVNVAIYFRGGYAPSRYLPFTW